MKICVFGAGAVGGHIAARLSRGGADVSVIARGAYLAAIKARGLTVRAPDASFDAAVKATDNPAQLGPQDAVIVTLKAPALPSLAASVAPLLGPDTAVVFAMNGIPWWYFYREGGPHDGRRLERLDPGDAVWRTVGPGRSIGAVVNSACTVVEPGIISVANAKSMITLGEPDGTISGRASAIAAALRAGGLLSDAVADIRSRIWAKLVLNLGTGPMGVLAMASGATIFTEPACCDAVHRIASELETLAAAYGCPVKADPEAQIANSRRLGHTASIVQDLQLGRQMEIDAIFTAPLALARLLDVPTPTLDLLVALAKLRAQGAGLYQGS